MPEVEIWTVVRGRERRRGDWQTQNGALAVGCVGARTCTLCDPGDSELCPVTFQIHCYGKN